MDDQDEDVNGDVDGDGENDDENEDNDEEEEQDDAADTLDDTPARARSPTHHAGGSSSAMLLSHDAQTGDSALLNGNNDHRIRPATQGIPSTPPPFTPRRSSPYRPPVKEDAITANVYDIVPTIAAPHSTSINSVTSTPDMRWVFSGGADGWIRKFNWVDTANSKSLLTVAQRHPFVDSVTKAGVLMSYWENEETAGKIFSRSCVEASLTASRQRLSCRRLTIIISGVLARCSSPSTLVTFGHGRGSNQSSIGQASGGEKDHKSSKAHFSSLGATAI